MSRVSMLAAVLIASTGLVTAQQVFRAGVDLVHFGVVVTDRSGAPILGLTPDDFEIVEEGKPAQIFAEPQHRLTRDLMAARLPDVGMAPA